MNVNRRDPSSPRSWQMIASDLKEIGTLVVKGSFDNASGSVEWTARLDDAEVKEGGVLVSAYGVGRTPDEAIRDLWNELTELEACNYIVLNAYKPSRKAYRWNGERWQAVQEKAA